MTTSARWIGTVATLAVLLLGWLAGGAALAQTGGCNSNDPGAPCFAQVPDILGGRRFLLRQDDLVVTTTAIPPDPGFSRVAMARLHSSNSTLGFPGLVPWDNSNYALNNFQTAIGRMFRLPHDVVATFAMVFDPGLALNVFDPGTNTSVLTAAPAQPSSFGGNLDALALADFTGDGYADAVVHYSTPDFLTLQMAVATARDVTNVSGGVTWGAVASETTSATFGALATGDFNGDGQPEIARVVCNGNCTVEIHAVDPRTLGISLAGSATLTADSAFSVSMAAGRFGTTASDQLVVLYQSDTGANARAIAVDVSTTLQPAVKASLDLGIFQSGFTPPVVRSGRLSWGNPFDVAVVQVSSSPASLVQPLSFSTDGTLTVSRAGAGLSIGDSTCLKDLVIGNFNRLATNPSPPPPTLHDPDLQIAILASTRACNALPGGVTVAIFNVAPDFEISQTSSFTLPGGALPVSPSGLLNLAAGDLQGRSLPLGPAEKATVVAHIQPDTVLGLPPMHVDWITPVGGMAPAVVNVSVFPARFNAQYTFQQTVGTQASRKSATSYTFATKESAGDKISYGIPRVASVSAEFKTAAQQTHQTTVARTYNTYQGQSFALSAATVFDDRVAATASRMNIYSYRVLGHCVPDAAAPALDDCPAGTRPLYLQLSGPDSVVYIDLAEAGALEWYQPVHEPGNLFSYPATLAQLQASQPPANPLQLQSAGNVIWDSQSPEQVSVTWTRGGGGSVSSGSVGTHTFDTSVSVSGSVKIDGFGVSTNAGFDYNQSQSVSTLNQSTSTFSQSTGVAVDRGIPGGPTSSQDYLYAGQSFIFGQAAPAGTIQGDVATGTTVQAQGYLAVGFAGDPLSTGAIQSGSWWRQAYTGQPDVALNHPQRWLQKEPTGTNPQQVWFNCPVGFSSSPTAPACTPTREAPTPATVADALFYQMKGLFVMPGTAPGGPQITMTTRGETVTLQARVYNYSLAPMPSATTVRVQFYAQPWDATTGQFQGRTGNPDAFAPAVFIGEGRNADGTSLGPIPAFCGGASGADDPCLEADAPRNWTLASSTWDTSGVAAGTYWKFWVVAWMEQSGQLVPEIPGHGLTAVPGSAGALTSLADVAVEPYSNNLGFYNQTFFVAPPATAGVGAAADTVRLTIDHVGVPRGPVMVSRPVTVRSRHVATGQDLDGVLALFYDGDPAQGGALFDVEMIPRVPAGGSFVAAVPFRPRACGTREIVVHAVPADGSAPTVMERVRMAVTADFDAELAALRQAIEAARLPYRARLALVARIAAATDELGRGHAGAAETLLRLLRREIVKLGDRLSRGMAVAMVADLDRMIGCIVR